MRRLAGAGRLARATSAPGERRGKALPIPLSFAALLILEDTRLNERPANLKCVDFRVLRASSLPGDLPPRPAICYRSGDETALYATNQGPFYRHSHSAFHPV